MNLIKNEQKRMEKLDKKRDEKCEPIATEILAIIAKYNIVPKALDHEKMLEVYGPVQKDINRLMKEKGLSISEANYTWSLVQAVIDSARNLSVNSIQAAFELCQQKVLGVDNVRDLTLQQIDNMLL